MSPKASEGGKAVKTYTEAEVAKHNSETDCWMSIYGKVYDVTKFLDDHPGGPEIMINVAGGDATEAFEEVFHSDKAKEMLADYYVGELEGWTGPSLESSDSSSSQISSNSGGMLYLIPLLIMAVALAYQFMA